MSDDTIIPFPKLDPWSASSLLQKAIRRGEAALAQRAVLTLQKFRGKGVWRRLASIAVEDIGIADPDLVWKVVRLANELDSREASRVSVLLQVIAEMSAAPKDRSADYVYCGATKLETALVDQSRFDALSFEEKLRIAASPLEPVTRRAVAALSACTVDRKGSVYVDQIAALHLASLLPETPPQLLSCLSVLTGQRSHPFGPMLILLWSHLEFIGGSRGHVTPTLPPAEVEDGIPLYTFDKHTGVGKRAIKRLVEESAPLRAHLNQFVGVQDWSKVAEMAAFYVDAVPVEQRLDWQSSSLLEHIGFTADMTSVGCPEEITRQVLDCVRRELPLLNWCRRTALGGRTSAVS